jgi:hypothetical protein
MERLLPKVKLGSHAWALSGEENEPCFRQALNLGIDSLETPPKIGNFRLRVLLLAIQLLKYGILHTFLPRKR